MELVIISIIFYFVPMIIMLYYVARNVHEWDTDRLVFACILSIIPIWNVIILLITGLTKLFDYLKNKS